MENFLELVFKYMSPLANPDFVGAFYIITSFMICKFTGMPLFIRLSLALPLFITAMTFILIPNTIPLSYENAVLIRLTHLVFMFSLIINSALYAFTKRKMVK